MTSESKKSILQMARGAIQERSDYAMSSIMENILDANTSATAPRKLTIILEFKPDDERQTIAVKCTAKTTLAPTSPVVTSLYVADENNVMEMVPQIPGQFCLDGEEQTAPPYLKIINKYA